MGYIPLNRVVFSKLGILNSFTNHLLTRIKIILIDPTNKDEFPGLKPKYSSQSFLVIINNYIYFCFFPY